MSRWKVDLLRAVVSAVCLVVGAALPGRAEAQTCSAAFCTIDMNSRIWLSNNTWGQDSSPPGWSESISRTGTSSFRIDFNWPTGPNNNAVKAFPSAVLGWHWGWHFQGTGLPIQLSANQNINTSYAYTANFGSGGTANIAYDIWLHTQNNPLFENPSDEVMIWVNSTGGAGPIGGVIATVNIDGASWRLHRGNIGWEVWSFVRTSNSSSGSLNVKNFTDYLRSTWGLNSSKYVTSVQFGSEIFHAAGSVNVTNYTATVGGGSSPPGGGGGIVANGTYRVIARHSGKALDVINHQTGDGSNVAQWAYGGGNNQRWTLIHLGNNVYQIVGLESGKALEVASTSTANGTNVDVRTYTGAANQRWTIAATSGGFFRLTPFSSSGSALDVSGNSTADGANVHQWSWTGANNQQWTFQAP